MNVQQLPEALQARSHDAVDVAERVATVVEDSTNAAVRAVRRAAHARGRSGVKRRLLTISVAVVVVAVLAAMILRRRKADHGGHMDAAADHVFLADARLRSTDDRSADHVAR